MLLSSWNVNGIRSALDKGFRDYVTETQPDVLCLQEVRALPDQVDLSWLDDLGYTDSVFNPAEKKGYSGVATFSKTKPLKSVAGMKMPEHDNEGRVLTTTFEDFHVINVYTPNSQNELRRLDYRMQWDADFLAYAKRLNRRKPVLICGDLNCAHNEIDLANPKSNRRNAGFTDEERGGLDAMSSGGFIDSFRHFCDEPEHYSWWSFRSGARARNVGWRIDYFWVAKRFMPRVTKAVIRSEVMGSDHCPVELELETSSLKV
ncbi:MAG: exodeoxyribonuclease III [Planctomycetota bacterium]